MADSDGGRQAALDYHAFPKPGKLEIRATKPLANGRDLARAYSPGVAEACLEIKDDGFLVAIDALKVPAMGLVLVIGVKRAARSCHVTVRAFDLDHFSAVIGQHHGAIGPRKHLREIDYSDVGQCAKAHYLSPQ